MAERMNDEQIRLTIKEIDDEARSLGGVTFQTARIIMALICALPKPTVGDRRFYSILYDAVSNPCQCGKCQAQKNLAGGQTGEATQKTSTTKETM